MNLHRWYWWTWPAGIAIGFAWSWVLFCVLPPRCSTRVWLRAWKTLVLSPAALVRRLNIRHH